MNKKKIGMRAAFIGLVIVSIFAAIMVVKSQSTLRNYTLNDSQNQYMVKNDGEIKEAEQKFNALIYDRQRSAFAYAQSFGIPEDQMERFELKSIDGRYHLVEMDEATYQKAKAERASQQQK